MDVVQTIEKNKKVITISVPLDENFKIKILDDKVVFEKARAFSEISEDVQKHLSKDYTDREIDLLVKEKRNELWGKKSYGS